MYRKLLMKMALTYHSNKRKRGIFNIPRMLINTWQSTICLLDFLLNGRQIRETECISRSKNYIVNIINMRAILKQDSSGVFAEIGDLLLDTYVRMDPRNYAK